MFKIFKTDIFSLFSSSLAGQIIHILALPLLTAWFSKTEIGAFFFFQALVIMGSIFVSLQSEQAIVVESNVKSYTCFKKSILIVFVLSLFVFLVLGIFPSVIELVSGKSTISEWIMYVPLALFIVGSTNSTEYLFTYEKRFWLISFFRITRPLSIYLFIFVFSFFGHNSHNTLILGFIAGNGLILLSQVLVLSRNKLCWFSKKDFSLADFKLFYQKHKKILVFNTISSGIVITSMQIPYIFISAVFGEAYSAFYGMSMRIVGMPLSILGQSFGQVFFPKISQINYQRHSIFPFVKTLIFRLYSFGIIPFLLIIVFVPNLFQLFLGSGWDMASLLSRVLLPWLFVLMVSAPVSNVISVLGIQLKTIYYDITLFLFRIIGLYICVSFNAGFITTMAIFSGIGVVFNLFFQFLILHFSRVHTSAS